MSEAKTDFSDALWRLLENKDFDDITVVDIVRVSGHSHASFYRCFEDKYELMSYSFEALLRPAVLAGLCNRTPEAIIEPFLYVAINNKRKILHALSSLDERALRRQAIEKLTYYVQLRLESHPSFKGNINARQVGLIFSNAAVGIFVDWLSGDMQLSFVEMREILVQWLTRIINMKPDESGNLAIESSPDSDSIERAVLQMLEDKTIDELRVGEIIERADTKRSAFYRQYRDKYDVANRFFARQAEERFAIKTQTERVVILTKESVNAYLNELLDDRAIVLNAINTSDSNGLKPFAIEYFTKLILDLARQEGVKDVQQIEPTIRMFCIGAVGHVVFWLKNPQQSTDEIHDALKLLFPAELVYGADAQDVSNTASGGTI